MAADPSINDKSKLDYRRFMGDSNDPSTFNVESLVEHVTLQSSIRGQSLFGRIFLFLTAVFLVTWIVLLTAEWLIWAAALCGLHAAWYYLHACFNKWRAKRNKSIF